MNLLFSGLITAGLLTSHIAAAADPCARAADRAAFEVIGLKSQLMVTALSCKIDEKYNAFVARFRPDLISSDKSLMTYFTRAYGRSATKQHDDYITQLANSQSQNGIRSGSAFCDRNAEVFDEVMSLRSGELADYAAGKSITQPAALTTCTTPERPTRAATSRRAVRH